MSFVDSERMDIEIEGKIKAIKEKIITSISPEKVVLFGSHAAGVAAKESDIDIGSSDKDHVLVAVYTERGSNIRIISCRKATSSERKLYEEGST